jgi:hypothetical protein
MAPPGQEVGEPAGWPGGGGGGGGSRGASRRNSRGGMRRGVADVFRACFALYMRRRVRRSICRLSMGGSGSLRRDVRIEWLKSFPLMPALPTVTTAFNTCKLARNVFDKRAAHVCQLRTFHQHPLIQLNMSPPNNVQLAQKEDRIALAI